MGNSMLARPGAARSPAHTPGRALLAWSLPPWMEAAIVFGLVLVGIVAQGLNMFHYPALTLVDDEGIYVERAWAVIRTGRLTPYTYVYDHAPAGWIQIAAWMGLTGGPDRFGMPVDSGRILMLLLHLAMIPIVYQLARKLGTGVPLAATAGLLFSLSPLALFYQRLVLIDTVMLFWVLLSINLLLDGWGRLSRVVLSGACFGIAILSKEAAIVLLPALLYIAVKQRRQHQGRFGVGSWLLAMLIVGSWYPLFAQLKGEFFPGGQPGTLSAVNGYASASVSLLASLWGQLTHGAGGPFNLHNQFWSLVRGDWMQRDAVLLLAGTGASVANLLRGLAGRYRNRQAFVAGLLGLLPLLWLARGAAVLDYAVVFVIPFWCLNIAVLLAPLFRRLPRVAAGGAAVSLPLALALGY